MKREMCRGDTILISIDAPVEYPVTTLQEAYVSIKQGDNEKLIPLSSFQLVTIPETGKQEYQYVISQKMSLGFEETKKHGYKVEISLVWLNQTGTRRQDPYKAVYEVYPTIYDHVMSGDSPIEPPDDYSGATEVTPSTETQVLPTRNKIVLDDITIYPAPTESLATNENGTFLPSSGNVGFSEVVVDVEPSLESLSVTENGLYLPESGTDGFDRVTVSVPIPTFETEEKTVTENGIYLPSAGVDGISKVTVDVPETIPDLIPLTATANGQYTATGHDGFSDVTVGVPPTVPVLQGKSVNPSETAQHVTPDSGYDGLSAVDVGAIPSSYVGSGITRRSGSDLTASGNTVNVPSGYYESSGSKTVQSGSAGTPTASKSAVSNNAVTVTPSVSNTEGYISGGTKTGNAVTVSASELVSGTKQVSITSNGTTTEDVTNYANAQITVNVVNQDYEDALTALGVTEDLTDSIEALTTYANGVTGESDTNLSDAVHTLGAGYGGGGSGLVYEEGTYTATANGNPTISFSGSHSTAPIFVAFADATGTAQTTANMGIACAFVRLDAFVPGGVSYNGAASDGIFSAIYHGTSSDGGIGGNRAISNNVSTSDFTPFFGTSSRTCQNGRTYKWIAIWR